MSLYPNAPIRRIVERARVADSLGYSHVWVGDSQNLWRELYVTMGAIATATERVVLGTGVTNAETRHLSTIASAWASLHELTDGRTAAGFGVGDSALNSIGLRPTKVDELGRLIGDLRALWRGEALATADGGEYQLEYLTTPAPTPVYLAASGPRLLSLAGAVADGVILLVGTDPTTVSGAIDVIARSAEAAGRRREDIDVVLWAPVAIDDDPQVAQDRVRPHVARTALRPIAAPLDPAEQEAVDEIRAAYDYQQHMVPGSPHSRLVTPSLVRRFSIAGTPAACAQQLVELGAAGVDEVAMIPFAADGPDDDHLLIERFAAL